MQLVETFVRNPVKVAVAVILLALFGTITVTQMPVELTPQIERPTLSISTRWPGAGPQEVEREIVYEQEKQLKAVPGLIRMTSRSLDSRGRIRMEFAVGTDMTAALVKTNTQLQQVREYPVDAQEPVIWSADVSSRPIASFSLIGRPLDREQVAELQGQYPALVDSLERVWQIHSPTLALERLQALAKEHSELKPHIPPEIDVPKLTKFAEEVIAARLSRVPGIARIMVWGGEQTEMQVVVDPEQLAARQLTIADVRQALRSENHDTSGGDFREGKRRYVVRTIGRFRSPEQVADVIIAVRDGAAVYVRDVAEVRLGYKKAQDSERDFDTPCIYMGASKEPGFNIMEAMTGLKKATAELNDGVLKQRGLFLHQSSDDTVYIDSAIGLVKKNIVVGGILTFCVLLLFLRSGRSTAVVALAIPVSIVGTFLMLGLMGRTLNVISLAGMAFAVGMLVDNAVVVLENVFRHYQRGELPMTAAVHGTKEVWGALLASTLTSMAVFLPVLFVQDEAGQLFRDIALAISCGVGLSLIVSVSVIPTAAARILRKQPQSDPSHASSAGERAQRPDGQTLRSAPTPTVATGLVARFCRWFVRMVVGVNVWLQRSVLWRLTVVAGFVGAAVFFSYLLLPPIEYLPQGNRNRVTGNLTPPPGYSTEQMITIGRRFHDAVRPYAERESGSPQAEGDSMPAVADFTYGTFGRSVWLQVSAVDPTRASELVPFLSKIVKEIPGTDGFIGQTSLFQGGWMASGRGIGIDVSGPELEKLIELATEIRDKVREEMPGAQAYPSPSLDLATPELHVIPNKARATAMGVRASDLGYTVDALVDGAYASDYFHKGDKIDLTIIGQDRFTSRTQDLDAIPIAVPTGQVVPLAALADVKLRSGPQEIAHVERQRAITINVTPPDEMALGEAMELIEQKVVQPLEASGKLVDLYQINLSGTADKLRATWAALRFNLLLALVITYLLMAGLFESWLYPFVIMVSVPLGVVGGLAGLSVMNLFVLQQLDVLTMLGFIILVGTVVNNAILIVHQSLNYMRQEGMPMQAAIVASVQVRIRPIFMTTFTTLFALLPLVLFPGAGSELYRGLGSVVLGGMLVSTMFTLVLVPTLFSLTLEAKAALVRLLTGWAAAEPVAVPAEVGESVVV